LHWVPLTTREANPEGRFPANLLVEDDVLDECDKSKKGSYSRYFSLDAWWKKVFPFLIVPKAAKSEKELGLTEKNIHPTVKPLKLMAYLITMGSRPGETILDPFLGSGTTAIAAKALNRNYIGIELSKEYVEIANARINKAMGKVVLEGPQQKVQNL
jgi:site-specific DNA-methyltransferase (adenine-specific)